MTSPSIKRYALAGTGSRGVAMFARPIGNDLAASAELVALFDHNPARMEGAKSLIEKDIPCFTDFDRMIAQTTPDCIIVATKDSTHCEFITRALAAGIRVYAEKPLCTTAGQCRDILAAAKDSPADGYVTHNMRYGPVIQELKRLLEAGHVGRLLSMEFRETLDRSHGADYFRRWHREKKSSGGLLIHKASHHFDILNWLADSKARTLSAMGGTVFYGSNGPFHSERCTGCPHSEKCDLHIDITDDETSRMLYLAAEKEDGYFRDGCVFDPCIDAEDQASVVYTYDNGVGVTYSLNAFAGYEGMLIVLEGTEGRIEYETRSNITWTISNRMIPGRDEINLRTLTFFHPRKGPQELEIPEATGGHGGADPALRDEFFVQPWDVEPSNRMATLDEAVQAVLIGAAANWSIASNSKPIDVQSLLEA